MTNSVKATAHTLHQMGVNITAIAGDGKMPRYRWKDDVTQRQDVERLRSLPWDGYIDQRRKEEIPAVGRVGIIHSDKVGCWRAFDIDALAGEDGQKQPVDRAVVERLLEALGLPSDYEWALRSGSGAGWHVYVRCEDTLPAGAFPKADKGVFSGSPRQAGAFGHIELRWHACQTVPAFGDAGVPADPPALVAGGEVAAAWRSLAAPPAPAPAPAPSADDTKQDIKRRLDILATARSLFGAETEPSGDDVRILGNGGLLVNQQAQTWYYHTGGQGGDVIDLFGYHQHGAAYDRKHHFLDALRSAADAAGVHLPDARRQQPTAGEQDGEQEMERLLADIREAAGCDFALNLLSGITEVLGGENHGQRYDDSMRSLIRLEMRAMGYGRRKAPPLSTMAAIDEGIAEIAYRNRCHPVRDFFDSLTWDGQDRIVELAGKFRCAEPDINYADGSSAPHIYVGLRRWLIGAVARVFEPTQNFVLSLSGQQDIGKSNFAKWLCPLDPLRFFTEAKLYTNDRDNKLRLTERFIWEIPEVDAIMRKSDVSALKAFLAKEVVTVRRAYGRYETERPAMASFIGTSNEPFLRDATGNRRFFVVSVVSLDWSYTEIDRQQLWAQAFALYRAGEPWALQREEREGRGAGRIG
jgi:hypothetical protein